jgi:Raf kinase inhibitor-like YbhB/YbcL family protein
MCCASLVTTGRAESEDHTMKLESSAVKAGERIPADYTADGKDASLPLKWSGAPEGTKEFALIFDDPDAPTPKPWVHWVLYNIPAEAAALPEGLPADEVLSAPAALKGATQGLSGWRKPGYRGPAPPPGKDHHYTFTLYALDADLDLKPGLNKDQLLEAMKGHVLATGQLVAIYSR